MLNPLQMMQAAQTAKEAIAKVKALVMASNIAQVEFLTEPVEASESFKAAMADLALKTQPIIDLLEKLPPELQS